MKTLNRIVSWIVAAALMAPAAVYGQVAGAQLSGSILDPKGAPVPGARVTLLELETNVELRAVSTNTGAYVVFPIKSGSYRITVEASGFQRLVRETVKLATGEQVRLDFPLTLGALEQTVTVNAETPLLRDASGNLGQVIDGGKIAGLPLNGRSYVTLAQLAPGVSLPPNSVLPRINGGRPRTNEYLFDGISVLQPEPGTVAFTPVIDAIQEFKIESNSPSAEFGRFNGGVVNLTMKSGTNQFHGSIFEFLRNEALNARNLFAPATVSNPNKPVFRRNQFGFTLGGPIESDKTFFFGDYQGSRQLVGRVRTSTVPTLAQRNGVFTQNIYDPVTRVQFAGNTIPTTSFDPVAVELLKRYPLPTTAATSNNYSRVGNERENQDQGDIRIDRVFSDRDRVFGRLSYIVNTQDPVTPFPDGSGTLTSGALGHTRTVGIAFASQYVHTFASSMTNEFRFGYTGRSVDLNATELASPPSTSLGIPGIPANAAFSSALPIFTIAGLQNLGPSSTGYSDTQTSVIQIADVFALQKGSHFFKAGADIRFERMNIVQPPAPTGAFTFSAVETAQTPASTTTGNAFASFLLGQVDSFSIDLQQAVLKPRAMIQEYFIQDEWKATRRLSVTAGVRYTLNFPSTEANDRGAVFNLDTEQLEYLGKDGFPKSARKLHKANFGPRLGLAYRATDRTVVRAGYSVVFIEMSGITTPFTNPYFPFLQSVGQRSPNGGQDPAFILANGPGVTPAGATPDAALGQGAFAVGRDLGSGYVQQWNLAIQREIRKNLSAEIAYAGSKITRVGIPDTNINQLTVDQLSLGNDLLTSVPNPYFGIIPGSSTIGGPTVTQAQLLKPFPRFTTVTLFRNNVGNTNYNALLLKIEQRFTYGLSLIATYTRSKLIDEASSVFDASIITGPTANFPVADSHDRKRERDVSTGDTPNVFTMGWTYRIPNLKVPHLHGLLSGWELTGIVVAQSGAPLALTQATNFNSFAGFGTQRPNRISDPALPKDQRTTAKWFDTAAFTVAPRFTLGNSSRNPVRGPAYRNADIALIKKTPVAALGEMANVEFRTEVFNLTNTPLLGAPNIRLGDAAFGSISSAGDPRLVQFGLRLNY